MIKCYQTKSKCLAGNFYSLRLFYLSKLLGFEEFDPSKFTRVGLLGEKNEECIKNCIKVLDNEGEMPDIIGRR